MNYFYVRAPLLKASHLEAQQDFFGLCFCLLII